MANTNLPQDWAEIPNERQRARAARASAARAEAKVSPQPASPKPVPGMGREPVSQFDVDRAILSVCRAASNLKLLGVLLEGSDVELGDHKYHLEETLFFISDAMSDAFCTLNEAGVKVGG